MAIDDNWDDFKTFVKEMRGIIKDTMKRQGGQNHVMVSIDLIDFSIDDWVHVNPYTLDLRTGLGMTERRGVIHVKGDVKHLLLHQRWKEE